MSGPIKLGTGNFMSWTIQCANAVVDVVDVVDEGGNSNLNFTIAGYGTLVAMVVMKKDPRVIRKIILGNGIVACFGARGFALCKENVAWAQSAIDPLLIKSLETYHVTLYLQPGFTTDRRA